VIRCVVFDFDGTLVLSNEIKREGFFTVARRFADGESNIERILRQVDGDRVAILTAFAELEGVANANELIDCYTRWCEDRIVACPERSGASEALDQMRRAGLQIHLSSATPVDSLTAIVQRRYPPDTFDGIHGGHAQKPAVLRSLVSQHVRQPTEMLCVGDGIDDCDAAAAVGCRFVGVSGGSLQEKRGRDTLLDDLKNLWPLVATMDSTRVASV
jgi:phosphoglycolate phosphatase